MTYISTTPDQSYQWHTFLQHQINHTNDIHFYNTRSIIPMTYISTTPDQSYQWHTFLQHQINHTNDIHFYNTRSIIPMTYISATPDQSYQWHTFLQHQISHTNVEAVKEFDKTILTRLKFSEINGVSKLHILKNTKPLRTFVFINRFLAICSYLCSA